MLYKLLGVVIAAFGFIAFLGVLGKYVDPGPPNSRSTALTPVAIIAAFIVIDGAANGPGAALFSLLFFCTVYIIGYIANGFSTRPN